MSFKSVEEIALDITQGYFSETIVYKRGEVELELKAVFQKDWVESNGVSTQELTSRITDFKTFNLPQKGDLIIRGDVTYKVDVAQSDSFNSYTLVLSR